MKRTFALLALSLACPQTVLAEDASAEPAPFDLPTAIRNGPPMTAKRAAELAVAAHPSLDEVRALSRASEASVARARAMMLPRLELSARYMHVDGFPDGKISTGLDPAALAAAQQLAANVSDPAARMLWTSSLDAQAAGNGVTFEIPRNQYGLSAQLTWPVSDMFFAMMPALDAAKAGLRADEARTAVTEAQVRRDAREAFYQLARARGGLAVALEAQRQAAAMSEQIEAAQSAGFLTQSDVLDAKAREAAAARAVASAGAGVEIADAALRTILGAGEGPTYGIAEPLLEADGSEPAGADELVRVALERRAEIVALEAAIEAQEAAVAANDAAGYPHLALVAGADYASPNRYVVPPSSDFDPSWQVGAVLSWSPNDTWTGGYGSDGLRARTAALRAQLDGLHRALRLEVRRARAEVRAAHEGIVAARSARAAAEAAYQSRLSQLRAGHATTADLFVAEGQVNQARLSELDAAVEIHLAANHLAHATGDEALVH